MYAFFRVDGVRDSLALCKRLVAEAGLGLAPGIAFGPEGEGFVRWCFAASEERLADGVARLRRSLDTRAAASLIEIDDMDRTPDRQPHARTRSRPGS